MSRLRSHLLYGCRWRITWTRRRWWRAFLRGSDQITQTHEVSYCPRRGGTAVHICILRRPRRCRLRRTLPRRRCPVRRWLRRTRIHRWNSRENTCEMAQKNLNRFRLQISTYSLPFPSLLILPARKHLPPTKSTIVPPHPPSPSLPALPLCLSAHPCP